MLLSLQGHSAVLAACACIASRVSPKVRILRRLKLRVLALFDFDHKDCSLVPCMTAGTGDCKGVLLTHPSLAYKSKASKR